MEKEEELDQPFKDFELPVAALKIQIENNAMLRLVLDNQRQIMDRLGIQQEFPNYVFNDVSPVENKADLKDAWRKENHIRTLWILIKDRLWEWVQLRASFTKEGDEINGSEK